MRFEFIHAEKARFPIAAMCRFLEVSRSGYYKWRKTRLGTPKKDELRLKLEVAAIHRESGGTYGSPRVYIEMLARGFDVGRHKVARLMREQGLAGAVQSRFRRGGQSRDGGPFAPDLVRRNFNPSAPNRTWVSDITYIRTGQGWLFLAVVIDRFSRRVVGWATANNMRSQLVVDALERALETRDVRGLLIHHSDRGSQYTSSSFRERLHRAGIGWSMGSTGCCYDNAVAESFFATAKKELIYRHVWPTREAARVALRRYIDLFYNPQRRHSALGYISPVEFEARYFQQQPGAALAA